MFTGIVAEAGTIQSIQTTPKSIALTVRARSCGAGLKPGDSVAVNGCCLTVVKLSGRGGSRLIQFDLLKESWKRTNFQYAVVGGMVNLERALRADAEFGGHFVTGHVDGLGKIIRWEKSGADHVLDISAPPEVMRYLIFKGSVAVDGISLTVSAVRKKDFRIWIIPHTFNITALCERKVGDSVNLEVDMLGKYVEKFLNLRSGR
jgi:riboflavin synthase